MYTRGGCCAGLCVHVQARQLLQCDATESSICRVGQNRIYTYIYTVYLVISKPKIPYVHRIYMVLASPKHMYTRGGCCAGLCVHVQARQLLQRDATENSICTPGGDAVPACVYKQGMKEHEAEHLQQL